jgi:organic hydroperoxide reductase OsmC/OhrA
MATTHRYSVRCRWSGATGAGYDSYDRNHVASSQATTRLTLSSDPAFRGDPNQWNPEQLVVLAASSCQLLSFLAVAARARLDVLSYEDEAEGEMPEDDRPMRLTRIVLRPQIVVGPPAREDRVRHLVDVAHRECYIANSLLTVVEVEAIISLSG